MQIICHQYVPNRYYEKFALEFFIFIAIQHFPEQKQQKMR